MKQQIQISFEYTTDSYMIFRVHIPDKITCLPSFKMTSYAERC